MVSTSCWRSRFPVCLLTCRKEMRSFLATAGYKEIGQETRESFKKPFQCARGTKAITPTEANQGTLQMDISSCIFESPFPGVALFSMHGTQYSLKRYPNKPATRVSPMTSENPKVDPSPLSNTEKDP